MNRYNIDEVVDLARTLQSHGVAQLKLHQLRAVGNAAQHPDMLITDPAAYTDLRSRLGEAHLNIAVILDDDLNESPTCPTSAGNDTIDRIETDPRGALTMSCKAVGNDSHAFWYDKASDRIEYRPSAHDEIALGIPDVVYGRV
ncbi:hypothetical protein [Nocardia sp. NPDC050718]|uniref:hypothetical protein n=1 Tax=Nocardia sp. NPDC050718 TaxID=3155788 RepID=UPI0033F37C69